MLLENARHDAERAVAAAREASISYEALADVIDEPLRCLARFLIWAGVPEEGEEWRCEHGHTYTAHAVGRHDDATATVKLGRVDYPEPCRCPWSTWHTSAFLPAWHPVQR